MEKGENPEIRPVNYTAARKGKSVLGIPTESKMKKDDEKRRL